MRSTITLFSLLFFFSFPAYAQFFLNGDAVELTDGCYQLTYNQMNNSGSIWYEEKINLDSSFVLLMDIFLGCENETGADGLVIGFQPISTSIGTAGGGLGFFGIEPSFGIEFDTWANEPFFDPLFDHLAIIQNGILDHSSSGNLAGPVPISATTDDIEDCEYHQLRITWDANSNQLDVYYDCEWRLSYQGDVVNDIFNGDPEVFWGVTSATGWATNYHRVCFNYTTFLDQLQDQEICEGESVSLQVSGGISYQWTPSIGLNNPFLPNPIATPETTTLYEVAITDDCGVTFYDDVLIEVATNQLSLDLGPDQVICEDIPTLLDASNSNAIFSWSTGETTPSISVQNSGSYAVTVSQIDSPCLLIDAVNINYPPEANIELSNDSFICENTIVEIIPSSLSGNIIWSDNSTQSSLPISEGGLYFAQAWNECGSDTDSIFFDFIPQPIAILPMDIEVCIGETVVINPLELLGDWSWSTGTNETSLAISNSSIIGISAENECGIASDSITIDFSTPPFIDFEDQYLFCEGQSLALRPIQINGVLEWENGSLLDSLIITETGNYQATAFNACGEVTAIAEVFSEDCQQFYIPNAFSPNDDGFNDYFYFLDNGNITNIEFLYIFDRWGALIFEQNNFPANAPQLGWNGKMGGQLMPSGVYTYFTKVQFRDKQILDFKGDIHLLR